ncbi:MAG: hypothetical protein ACHQ53_13260 [Polyangiales bacterium]
MIRMLTVILLACAPEQLACASERPSERGTLDLAFASIQRNEAGIEHARASTGSADASCCEVCAAANDAAAEQVRLCGTAREAADVDALSRCESAQRSVRSIAERAGSRCRCAR